MIGSVHYTNFFLGSVTVAGALTGLLFVALSVAQGRDDGQGSAERQAVAATAFTALVDSLWISLVALLPGNGIPTASLLLGVLGLTSTAALIIRLWRARSRQKLSHRWPVLLLLIVAMYIAQAVSALTTSQGEAARRTGATFVLIFFAVGIARSWELLGLRGGGLLDFLVARAESAVPAGSHEQADGSGPQATAGPDTGRT
ncbi:MAG TPA: hypothetical protein VMU94_20060 [Streptosporangiaceae bacterium]|nr:hypothetical protein [Streptosporangiaceae bacterium]